MAQDGLAYIKWLRKLYGDPEVSFVPYAGALAPFLSGTVQGMQCFAMAEPLQLKADGVDTRVFYLADAGYNPYVSVIAVNDEVLKSRPEMVEKFVNAVRRGWDAYLAKPDETNALLRELNPDLSEKVVALAGPLLGELVESDVTRAHATGWMTEERWATLIDQLIELEELDADDREKAGTVFFNPPLPVTGQSGVAG